MSSKRLPVRSRGMLVVLIAGCAAVAAAVAVTLGGSSQVIKFPTGGNQIFGYQLTSDTQGAATIVWSTSRFVGDTADSLIRVSGQNAQGKWSAPTQVGTLHQSLNPVLAESTSGAAVIVWSWIQSVPHERSELEAVTRSSADSAWSPPRIIWAKGAVDDPIATVGIDSSGTATVVWTGYASANQAIWTSSLNTTNATASPPRELIPASAGGADVTLALNGRGAAVLGWQHQLGTTPHTHELPTIHAAETVAYRTAAGQWLPPHQLPSFSYQEEPVGMGVWGPSSPSSTVTADGTAATTWLVGSNGDGGSLRIASRNPVTGNWSAAHTLDSAQAFDHQVTAGPAESLLALWSSDGGSQSLTATSTDDTHWSTAKPIAGSENATAPYLTSDTHGAHATIAIAGPHSRILVTTRTDNNNWSALTAVGTGFDPEVTVSPTGSTTVAWAQAETAGGALETRSYH